MQPFLHAFTDELVKTAGPLEDMVRLMKRPAYGNYLGPRALVGGALGAAGGGLLGAGPKNSYRLDLREGGIKKRKRGKLNRTARGVGGAMVGGLGGLFVGGMAAFPKAIRAAQIDEAGKVPEWLRGTRTGKAAKDRFETEMFKHHPDQKGDPAMARKTIEEWRKIQGASKAAPIGLSDIMADATNMANRRAGRIDAPPMTSKDMHWLLRGFDRLGGKNRMKPSSMEEILAQHEAPMRLQLSDGKPK